MSTGGRKAVLLIPLEVGNKLVIVHFWISVAEVKTAFKDSSVIMLECLKISERAGMDRVKLLSK